MTKLVVRFDRQTESDEDLEIAQANFPNEKNELILLYDQFVLELRENIQLRGLWRVVDHIVVSSNCFVLWVEFEWSDTIGLFSTAVQQSFDEYGMSGKWMLLSE